LLKARKIQEQMEIMSNNEFGVRLKELRTAKAKKLGRRKIPQREVAEHLNISPGAYGSWESGRTRPDTTLLPKIADYFGVSIDFLLGYKVGAQIGVDADIAETALKWSLSRAARTEDEQKGIEAWRRLTQGEDPESIATMLKTHFPHGIECYIKDAVYADLISIDRLPQEVDLAEQVRRAFGLRDVVVVPVAKQALRLFKSILLGEAARFYFKTHVSEGMKVGLAGGYSVGRLVYSLRRGECRGIEVYPLAISPVTEAVALDANSLVGALTYRHDGYNVRGYTLQYASPLNWKGVGNNIRQYAPTRRVLAKARSVDIAFMGVGVLGRRRAPIDLLGDLLDLVGPGLEEIRGRGAVGDILYHLVDQYGEPVSPEISNLICSIDLQDLREMVQMGVRVVAIASGQRKAEIAQAAIKAGYANVFIIDDELAQALLELAAQPG
jgi:DNA-binding transcriptional regulator LsrR (DeoR family)/DNA-binding XRE family transcriptional regulator